MPIMLYGGRLTFRLGGVIESSIAATTSAIMSFGHGPKVHVQTLIKIG